MIHHAHVYGCVIAIFSWAVLGAQSQELPDYWKGLVTGQTTPAETVATSSVLALNTSMFDLYDSASQIFTKNILAAHPVILALFSGAGGSFTLYRPGRPPLTAPLVPMVYQVLKSVGHSSMALAEIVGPYLTRPQDQSWRSPMLAFRSRMQSALEGLDAVPMPGDWRENVRTILKCNLAFMDDAPPNARSRLRRSRSLVVSRLHFWLRMSLGQHRFKLLIGWMWSATGNRCWGLIGTRL